MPEQKKPNILIMSDDIGWFNVSAYNNGIMGYRTPNIDSIAKEGALFTDFYGQQSCTAGRAAFITGQAPIRTGLTKAGLPGANFGLSAEDPTVAQFLKQLGYATFNLRSDPFEAAENSSLFYDKWFADRGFVMVPAQANAAKWLESFKEFPIRQKPAAFNLDRVVEQFMPQ
jgi:arylsulfatase A-like enzyme